jgi:hypothetical protein
VDIPKFEHQSPLPYVAFYYLGVKDNAHALLCVLIFSLCSL